MKTKIETTTVTTSVVIDSCELPALAVAHMIAYGLALRGVRASVLYGEDMATGKRNGTIEVQGFFGGLGERERFNGLFLECAQLAMQAHELSVATGHMPSTVQS